MSDACVFCNRNVRPRQQAITCDLCDRWQHRTCNTGIPQDRYRRAQRGEIELRFVCTCCRSETDTDFSVDLTGPPTHSSTGAISAIKTVAESTPEEVVSDYEAALWKAIRKTIPHTSMNGCVFHWGQAVWRHVQSLGLATEYVQDKGTCSLIRMIFCLPFLPAEHITETFDTMEQFSATDRLRPLFDYLRHTWISSTTWPVTTWSVFGQSIRTNNDVEGWHRRLNTKAGKAPAFYNLVLLLHRESDSVDDNVQMVTELINQRIQRKTYRNMQSKIFQAWDIYREKTLTTSGLLKTLSTIYKPRILRTSTDNEDTN